MQSRKLRCVVVVLLSALVISVGVAAEDKPEHKLKQLYNVSDLGTLGGTFSEPSGVNIQGWVSGRATLPGGMNVHATLWRDGSATDLGTFGGPNSWAWVPGDQGIIPGQAETPQPDPLGEDFCFFGTNLVCLPFVWQNGVLSALPTLGGNNGVAVEINHRGQVVGYTENASPDPNCLPPQVLQVVAVVWRNGQVVEQLPPFAGDSLGFAMANNERGHVTGSTGLCYPSRAVLWTDGTVIDLGSLGGITNNFPFDINNQDEVVGDSDLAGDTVQHAFLWTRETGMQDLGTLPGDTGSSTESINNRGQIVGVSYTDVSSNAFIWEDGVMTNLNTLTCPGSIFLANALGINDQGQIIGDTVTSDGEVHAYLATPTKECEDSKDPSTRVRITTPVRVLPKQRYPMFGARPLGPLPGRPSSER